MRSWNRVSNRGNKLPDTSRQRSTINIIAVTITLLLLLLPPIATTTVGGPAAVKEELWQLRLNAVSKSQIIASRSDSLIKEAEAEAEKAMMVLTATVEANKLSDGDASANGKVLMDGGSASGRERETAAEMDAAAISSKVEQLAQNVSGIRPLRARNLKKFLNTSTQLQTTTTKQQLHVVHQHVSEQPVATPSAPLTRGNNELVASNYILLNSSHTNNIHHDRINSTTKWQQQVAMQPQMARNQWSLGSVEQQPIIGPLHQLKLRVTNTKWMAARENEKLAEDDANGTIAGRTTTMNMQADKCQRSSQVALFTTKTINATSKINAILHSAQPHAGDASGAAAEKLGDSLLADSVQIITRGVNQVTIKSSERTTQFDVPATAITAPMSAMALIVKPTTEEVISDSEKSSETSAEKPKGHEHSRNKFTSSKYVGDKGISERNNRINAKSAMPTANYLSTDNLKVGSSQQQWQKQPLGSLTGVKLPKKIKNDEVALTKDIKNVEKRLTLLTDSDVKPYFINKNAKPAKSDKDISHEMTGLTNKVTTVWQTGQEQAAHKRMKQSDLKIGVEENEEEAHPALKGSKGFESSVQGEQQRWQSQPQQSISQRPLSQSQRYLEPAEYLHHTKQQSQEFPTEKPHQQSRFLLKPKAQQLATQFENPTAKASKYFSETKHSLNTATATQLQQQAHTVQQGMELKENEEQSNERIFVGKQQTSRNTNNKSEFEELQQHKMLFNEGGVGRLVESKDAMGGNKTANLAENYSHIGKQVKLEYKNNNNINSGKINESSSDTNKNAMFLQFSKHKTDKSTAEAKLRQATKAANISTKNGPGIGVSKQTENKIAADIIHNGSKMPEELQRALKYANKQAEYETVAAEHGWPTGEFGKDAIAAVLFNKQVEKQQQRQIQRSKAHKTQEPPDVSAAFLSRQNRVNKSTEISSINFTTMANIAAHEEAFTHIDNSKSNTNIEIEKRPSSYAKDAEVIDERANIFRTEEINEAETVVQNNYSTKQMSRATSTHEASSFKVKPSQSELALGSVTENERKSAQNTQGNEVIFSKPKVIAEMDVQEMSNDTAKPKDLNISTTTTPHKPKQLQPKKIIANATFRAKMFTLAEGNDKKRPFGEIEVQHDVDVAGSQAIGNDFQKQHITRNNDWLIGSLPLPPVGEEGRVEIETIADWQQQQNLLAAYIRRPDMRTGEALKLNVTLVGADVKEIAADSINAEEETVTTHEPTIDTTQLTMAEQLLSAHSSNNVENTTTINPDAIERMLNGAATVIHAAEIERLELSKERDNENVSATVVMVSEKHAGLAETMSKNSSHSNNGDNAAGSLSNADKSTTTNTLPLATDAHAHEAVASFDVVTNTQALNAQSTVLALANATTKLHKEMKTTGNSPTSTSNISDFPKNAAGINGESNSNRTKATIAPLLSTTINSKVQVYPTALTSIAADWAASGTQPALDTSLFVLPTLAGLASTTAAATTAAEHALVSTTAAAAAAAVTIAPTATTSTPGASWPVKHASLMEGDVILGGLMMVHSREDTITCGPIMPQGGIQALEAMLYTLDQVNKQQLLPNVTLGAHILDDCDKDTYGLEMAVDFIKGKIRQAVDS